VWEISSDYFKYPTVTSVSVVDFLPLTTIPQVAICTPWDVERGNKSYVERFQEQLMEKPPDGSHPGGDPVLHSRQVPPPVLLFSFSHIANSSTRYSFNFLS
jgi:hypothetical protein